MATVDRRFGQTSTHPAGRFASRSTAPAVAASPADPLPRDRVRDLTALSLLAGCVFLVASLATFDPADPPSARVFPPHARATNACGLIGAVFGNILQSTRGIMAVGLGAVLASMGWHELEQPVDRDTLVRRTLAAALMTLAIAIYAMPS